MFCEPAPPFAPESIGACYSYAASTLLFPADIALATLVLTKRPSGRALPDFLQAQVTRCSLTLGLGLLGLRLDAGFQRDIAAAMTVGRYWIVPFGQEMNL